MRRYETIIILRPTLTENQIDSVIDNATDIITSDGGTIIELDRWGMRKLAYLIKKEKQGFYTYLDYSSQSDSVSEMERKFRIDDSVLKYMTIKLADSISDEEISDAQGEAEKKRAAVKAAEEAAQAEEDAKTEEAPQEVAEKPAEKTTEESDSDTGTGKEQEADAEKGDTESDNQE